MRLSEMAMPVRTTLRRIGGSVFLKVLAVFVGAMVLIVGYAAVNYIRFWEDEQLGTGAMALHYSGYVLEEIGSPPDTALARQTAERLGMGIRILGPGVDWASSEHVPPFEDIALPENPAHPDARAGISRAFGIGADFTEGAYRYFINLVEDEEGFGSAPGTKEIVDGLFALAVLLLTFLMIRGVLRPVRVLSEGVERIRRGDLDVEMETRRTDELGRLIQSFNEMVRVVRERIEARDQLLLDVSHEVRSPLTRMKIALEMMPWSPERESVIDDIAETEAMISELLETERLDSRHGGLTVGRVDIARLLRECGDLHPDAPPGIDLRGTDRAVSMPGDGERLRMVFKNVLSNAVKYSSPRGAPVRVVLDVDDDSILVSFHDHGVGIGREDLRHVFEPFYRVDRSRSKETGGYGLGLSLAKRIVEAHGGEIEVSSEVGRGTSVLISLPRKGPVAAPRSRHSGNGASHRQPGMREVSPQA
jgi:signal transduction histidine kinase